MPNASANDPARGWLLARRRPLGHRNTLILELVTDRDRTGHGRVRLAADRCGDPVASVAARAEPERVICVRPRRAGTADQRPSSRRSGWIGSCIFVQHNANG
jgi:hypothetical protein